MKNKISRRGFIAASGAMAAVAASGAGEKAAKAAQAGKGKLITSAPMLQNHAENSVGVAFAVSDMANGFVEYSTSPDMKDAVKVKCGGYRVTDMNNLAMRIRLRNLKPATKYYYRIGADRIEYKHGYSMKITGTETDPEVRSFTTAGAKAESRFAVVNDTHNNFKSMELVFNKVEELDPPCVMWNGDATNTEETFDRLVTTYLRPGISKKDYAAKRAYCLVQGNHEYRGMANRQSERIWMFRDPEERPSRDWDLGRNFAVRQGDIALIGLDTAEDKLDSRDVFAGLFCSEPYREAQAVWLKDALERPEIKSAPHLVACCHIPIFDPRANVNPGDLRPNDNGGHAAWQRMCGNLWGPLLSKAGCQLVVTAHQHRYRFDAPSGDRAWAQIVGGGPELGEVVVDWKTGKTVKDATRFPTVVDVKAEGGKLKVVVHDVFNKRIVEEFTFDARA
jgi:hypothetical protein